MIILASSSPSRANILSQFNIEFKQIIMENDESSIPKTSAKSYSMNVVTEKSKQFFSKFKDEFANVLFADSSVICNNIILNKAKDIDEARWMLNLQSGNFTSVYTAMKFFGNKFCIDMLSVATYKFNIFDKDDMQNYLSSGLWQKKAGAMMIEGFNEKYIQKSYGNKQTAMGLDIKSLKVFL